MYFPWVIVSAALIRTCASKAAQIRRTVVLVSCRAASIDRHRRRYLFSQPTAATWTLNRIQPETCRLTAGLNRPTLGSPECWIVEGTMEKRLLGGVALLVAFCS